MAEWWQGICDQFVKCFIREDRYMLLLDGIGVTIKVTILALIIGLILGFLIALCNLSKNKLLKSIGGIYTDVIRGTPSVTQLMIIYFVVFASIHWAKWVIAAIAFGINSGAYVSEIIRAGINSIDKGQMEAGLSLGLKYGEVMRLIILPQAIRNILPALGNEFITLLKETSVGAYIGIVELTKASDIIASSTYDYFFPLIIIAIIYLIMTLGLSKLVNVMERRLNNARN